MRSRILERDFDSAGDVASRRIKSVAPLEGFTRNAPAGRCLSVRSQDLPHLDFNGSGTIDDQDVTFLREQMLQAFLSQLPQQAGAMPASLVDMVVLDIPARTGAAQFWQLLESGHSEATAGRS